MAKATITYDLEDIDDKAAFERAVKAIDLWAVLYELQQELRRLAKHEELTAEVYDQVDKIRDFLYNTMLDHNIDLDALYH